MLAAAALMFAACAQFDTVNEVPESEPQAIGFDTYAQLPTRTTENNGGTYTGTLESIHETFSVWANKFVKTTYTAVYTDETVRWTGTPKAWTPDTKAYWDKTASNYYFYAAAPADINWVYAEKTANNGSTGYFTLTGHELNGTTALEGKTADKDLLIADVCDVARIKYNKDAPETVGLQFIHILSKLNINVKTSSTATIKLNGITVGNLKTKATFNEGIADANNVSGSYTRWTNDGSTTTEYLSKGVNALSSTSELVLEGFVIPQNAAYTPGIDTNGSNLDGNPYIKIDYTIGTSPDTEDFEVYYNLADVFNGANTTDIPFNEGWQNTLTITISPDDIQFSGAVSTWSEGAGSGSGSGIDID